MVLRESAEDYLEVMLVLREKHGYIRSVDIAEEMGVKRPSVSYATKRLRENGYITMNEDNYIFLTDAGLAIATRTYNRHKTLTALLVSLGVDESVAQADACKLEHDLSEESYAAIAALITRLQEEERSGK